MAANRNHKEALRLDQLTPDQRYRALVESLGNWALYLIDLDGRVASWNSGAERIFGFSESEAKGRLFEEFFCGEDRATGTPENILRLAVNDGRSEWEGWRIGKDGNRLWTVATVSAVRDDRRNLLGYTELARDATQRDANSSEAEHHFKMLVDALLDYAIYMLDPNGIVISWNAGAERIKGYRAEEIIGRHFSCFYTAEDRAARVPAKMLATAAREGRYEGEHIRVRKDGSRFWADVVIDPVRNDRDELIGFAKITRDISERRAAQDALAESERQFRLLIAGVTDYAIYMLDPNGIVTSWNAGAQRIKGYLPSEIIGRHFSIFYTEEDRATGLPLRSLYTATEQGRFEAEGWRVRKDGTRFWASVVLDAIRDEIGRLIGFAKITRDITERMEAQQAVHRAQEQLAHAQKMEALGQLTGGIAHDFNNLLMVVAGQAALMKRRLTEAKDIRALDAIEYAVSLGSRLTRQLLSFGQRQPVTPATIDLHDRVSSFQDLLSSSARGNVRLEVTIGADVWPIYADPNELELALVNLAVNARDAMPDGGTITLSAENRRMKKGNELNIEGEFVAISVKDTGIGIRPENLSRVFEPFFTTKGQGKGTGLGLAQVHGFATRSGGTVGVSSKSGDGTTMTLYLPRSPEHPRGEDVVTTQRVPEAVSGTILVVEDNPDVRAVSATLLEQMGYQILFADSAASALDILAQNQKIDLVFSDIVMPGEMDGIGLARTIRAQKPEIAVLLTSGYARAAETAERDFPILRKPYEVKALAASVAAAIRTRRASLS